MMSVKAKKSCGCLKEDHLSLSPLSMLRILLLIAFVSATVTAIDEDDDLWISRNNCPAGYWGSSCSTLCFMCEELQTRCSGLRGCYCVEKQRFGFGCTSFCDCPDYCSHSTGECLCRNGIYGPRCEYPCPGVSLGSVCSGHGTCDATDVTALTCTCEEDWTGSSCEIPPSRTQTYTFLDTYTTTLTAHTPPTPSQTINTPTKTPSTPRTTTTSVTSSGSVATTDSASVTSSAVTPSISRKSSLSKTDGISYSFATDGSQNEEPTSTVMSCSPTTVSFSFLVETQACSSSQSRSDPASTSVTTTTTQTWTPPPEEGLPYLPPTFSWPPPQQEYLKPRPPQHEPEPEFVIVEVSVFEFLWIEAQRASWVTLLKWACILLGMLLLLLFY